MSGRISATPSLRRISALEPSTSQNSATNPRSQGMMSPNSNNLGRSSSGFLHQYDELIDGIPCSSCNGTGRIPRNLEKEMVALIPFSDKRLRPRRTWLWVMAAVLISMALCSLLLFFLVPRSITVFSNDPSIAEVSIVSYSPNVRLVINFLNGIKAANDNFFSVRVSNATSNVVKIVFPDQHEVIGRGTMMNLCPPFHKVTLYESATKFYIVGTDLDEKTFCLLEISQDEDNQLKVTQNENYYSRKELNALLSLIHDENNGAKPGLKERISGAKGVLGFIRFLEGYYLILVTKASRLAQLGFHWIYKIEETEMLAVPNKTDSPSADEQRYVKLFQSLDLSMNFYFSYTFDLSRTLQSNVTDPGRAMVEKFVWNTFLMRPIVSQNVSQRWMLPVIHGFVGAASLAIRMFNFNLILIARRSNKFAGTRFLKRGANNAGYVANEVETEQIIADASICSFEHGRFTSFVQLRGSVPLMWSQDFTKVVGKPPIQLDTVDPFAVAPGLHFQSLRAFYGDPVVVINLVKTGERRQQERILHEELDSAISYLNQFLSPSEVMLYVSFDMARCHKSGNVLPELEDIAYRALKVHGWFQSFPSLYVHKIRPGQLVDAVTLGGRQRGVPRTSCVDCLDRTNVAQFIIGKVALCCQLHALGLLNEPRLNSETQICRILETLYEQHGDTLALQYAGSHLVHSIRTYKKISLFQERSRDVIQTLSRYYSNTFADYEKQNAINLFLGVFRPSATQPHIWEMSTDAALHDGSNNDDSTANERRIMDYCDWFRLPNDFWEKRLLTRPVSSLDGRTILGDFERFYRTFELSSLDALLFAGHRSTVYIDSVTSPPTMSSQPFMRLWKRQRDKKNLLDPFGTPVTEERSTNGKTKSEYEQDASSSEGELSSNSVIKAQYSIQWQERAADANVNDGRSGHDDAQQARRRAQHDHSEPRRNVEQRQLTDVYKLSLRPRQITAEDMRQYEQFVQLRITTTTNGDESGDRQSPPRHHQPLFEHVRRRLLESQRREQDMVGSRRPTEPPFPAGYVETPSLTVDDISRRTYQLCIACASVGGRMPSVHDMKIYGDYVHQARQRLYDYN